MKVSNNSINTIFPFCGGNGRSATKLLTHVHPLIFIFIYLTFIYTNSLIKSQVEITRETCFDETNKNKMQTVTKFNSLK